VSAVTAKFSPITGRYVHLTVQGVEYRVYFEEAGKGTPVLMQHTAGSDGRQWRHILEDEKLTSEFRFIAHDLPYHGKSLPPLGKPWWRERYSLSQSFAIEFIEAMTKALGIEKGIYVGCSMGGHLAPDLALAKPGLFRAVIAVEGGLATHDPEPFLEYLSHPRTSNETKAGLMLGQMSPHSPEPFRRETAWVYSQGGPQVFRGDLDYYLGEHDLTHTASKIDTSKTQVHVISGDYDWSATPERSRALADAIKGATYTQMPGMGHFPMSEHPEAFKTYLTKLLAEIMAK
jgi:pimeloyl-ACP methyl ester carboxylesterase